MKKSDFFSRLQEEGKLQLVPPSEDIMTSYLKKSDSHLISAKLLLENVRLEESVSLTYYSMYYMLLSLFFRAGIKCENHSAAIILLKELFNIDNSLISYAKKERIDKQYYVDFKIMKEEVEELISAKDQRQELMKEIGDVYEIIDAIIDNCGLGKEEIMKLKNERDKERGGFDKKIFLESVARFFQPEQYQLPCFILIKRIKGVF